MRILVQKTIRVDYEKAELIEKIREENDLSWNAIVDIALDKLIEKVTIPAPQEMTIPPAPEIILRYIS
jgi:hypothetical protein